MKKKTYFVTASGWGVVSYTSGGFTSKTEAIRFAAWCFTQGYNDVRIKQS
jgi:hypothetical protein